MSWQAVSWASGRAPSAGGQLALYGIADRADEFGVTYAGQEDLATCCCVGVRTMRRSLAQLERAGLIARIRRHDSRGHVMGGYTILAPLFPDRGRMEDLQDDRHGFHVAEIAREGRLVADLAARDPQPAKSAARDGHQPAKSDTSNRPNPTHPTGQIVQSQAARLADKQLKTEQSVQQSVEQVEPEVGETVPEPVMLTGWAAEKLERIELVRRYAQRQGIEQEDALDLPLETLRAGVSGDT